MNAIDERQLALMALYNLNTRPTNSSFTSNPAGLELMQRGKEAVPVIEELIRDVIGPVAEVHAKQFGEVDLEATFRDGLPLSGVDYVLKAYWVICARVDPRRAVDFMTTAPPNIVAEALGCMIVFFSPSQQPSDIPFPREYAEFLISLRESNCGVLQRASHSVMAKFQSRGLDVF